MKLLMILLATAALNAQSTPADRILGTWLTPNGESKIEIVKCGEAYCGSIKWMKSPKMDANNPDASLKGRPLTGVQIMKAFKYTGNDTWAGGTLYGPERGKEVSPKIVLTAADSLDVKVTLGVARKTVTWTREK